MVSTTRVLLRSAPLVLTTNPPAAPQIKQKQDGNNGILANIPATFGDSLFHSICHFSLSEESSSKFTRHVE